MPSADSTPAARVFFEDILFKRVAKPRESKKAINFPRDVEPPFTLTLDYSISDASAVVIQLNGTTVLEGREVAEGRGTRHVERELDLSIWEPYEVFTAIVSTDAASAKVQIVGRVASGNR
jgi:hypothetical protein